LAGRWSEFNWLRIGIGGSLLWTRWRTFGFWCHGIWEWDENAFRREAIWSTYEHKLECWTTSAEWFVFRYVTWIKLQAF
jgi:hypothetical protein